MNEPKLRFKTDDGSRFPDLKKISLESLMTFKNGINADGSKFGHGVKCISVMDILNNAYITHDIIKGAVNIDEKTLSNFSVEYGDVLFQRSSENVQDAGRANVYIDKDKIATYSGFVIRGKKISEYEPVFMNNLLNTFTVRKQIMSKAQGAQHINIGQEILSSIAVKIPCLPEQQKIASLFSELDALIQSAEKELDGYRELKQGMLQKMFPKKGERVPEIRFPEFTDDWKCQKLGDLAKIVGGGTPSTANTDFWDGEINWFAPAEITNQVYVSSSERKITELGYNSSSAKMLPIGTVLFTSRAGIGKTAILSEKACTNQGFQSIVPDENKLDSYFIFSRSAELKRYGETIGAGSTFVEVSGKQMAAMSLMMPPTFDEQKKIGEYFSNLDNLITLQQQELDGYKELKKGLLQQMFC